MENLLGTGEKERLELFPAAALECERKLPRGPRSVTGSSNSLAKDGRKRGGSEGEMGRQHRRQTMSPPGIPDMAIGRTLRPDAISRTFDNDPFFQRKIRRPFRKGGRASAAVIRDAAVSSAKKNPRII